MSAWDILWQSLPENIYIIICAVISIAAAGLSIHFANVVKKAFEEDGGKKLKNAHYYDLHVTYTVFIALISIFPLLGMFGTVMALLGLDMSGDMDMIKLNFFRALTSTAWGIIFAVLGKIAHAAMQPYVENQITNAQETLGIKRQDGDE